MEEDRVGGSIQRLTKEVREDSASCGPGNGVDGGPSVTERRENAYYTVMTNVSK